MYGNAIQLLAGLLKWPEEKVREAIEVLDQYRVFKKPKKSGGFRTISEPHPILKQFQKRLLHYFLYRIPLLDRGAIHGCRLRHSHITNAAWHANKNMRCVLRLDLKNAFPSVKRGHIRIALKEIFESEIGQYQKNAIPVWPIFSHRRAKWFREIVKVFPQRSIFSVLYDQPEKIIEDLVEPILSLTTFKGKLPQGAPTSPYLLNIIVSHSGVLTKLRCFLEDDECLIMADCEQEIALSVYVDDFTISSSKPIKRETIASLIEIIEKETHFKVNRKKILCFQRDRIAPLVTGLRIITLKRSAHQLAALLRKDSHIRTEKEFKNAMRREMNDKGEWVTEKVRLPKCQIRKIRGLIHRACLPEYREKLASKVEGHIAHLKAVYGDVMPRQIAVPWKRYQSLH